MSATDLDADGFTASSFMNNLNEAAGEYSCVKSIIRYSYTDDDTEAVSYYANFTAHAKIVFTIFAIGEVAYDVGRVEYTATMVGTIGPYSVPVEDEAIPDPGVETDLPGYFITQSYFWQGSEAHDSFDSTGAVGGTAHGGAGDDQILGRGGAETILGDAGNDYLEAGEGDTLDGGDDVDWLDLRAWETTEAMRLNVREQASEISALNSNYSIGGFEKFYVEFGTGDDELDLAGGVIVSKFRFRDIVDPSDSRFIDAGGQDTLTTDASFRGVAMVYGFDVLNADLTGLATVARIFPGSIKAGKGRIEWESGGASSMTVTGGDAGDRFWGSIGRDEFHGGLGNDIVKSGGRADQVFGDDGDDKIWGDSGDDLIFGGVGSDFLSGGGEDDELTGGEGSDRFQFGIGYGVDTVTDFDAEGTDSDRVIVASGIRNFQNLLRKHVSDQDDGVVISIGAKAELHLLGISVSDLNEHSFAFN